MSKENDFNTYTSVEFPELQEKVKEEPLVDPRPGVTVSLDPAIAQIEKELGRIQSGQSELRKGAVSVDRRSPVLAALARMKEDQKNVDQMREFVTLSYQDLGRAVTHHFIDLLAEAYPRIKDMKNG